MTSYSVISSRDGENLKLMATLQIPDLAFSGNYWLTKGL